MCVVDSNYFQSASSGLAFHARIGQLMITQYALNDKLVTHRAQRSFSQRLSLLVFVGSAVIFWHPGLIYNLHVWLVCLWWLIYFSAWAWLSETSFELIGEEGTLVQWNLSQRSQTQTVHCYWHWQKRYKRIHTMWSHGSWYWLVSSIHNQKSVLTVSGDCQWTWDVSRAIGQKLARKESKEYRVYTFLREFRGYRWKE